ncbi:MAG: hypothetical protein JKY56_17970, partial [Kofleriaceae bacterium]|nr:hypothetical protein [Kofleriaceae bacterium]
MNTTKDMAANYSSLRMIRVGWSFVFLVLIVSCASPQSPPFELYRGDAVKVRTLRYTHGSSGFDGFFSSKLRQVGLRYPDPAAEIISSPIGLTTRDGTGLVLKNLDVHVRVDGPLAFTELRMQFHNPRSWEVEGRFQITLPVGATVSSLSMKTDNRWHSAEMVEKAAARQSYEDFLHKKQDPMLLEKEAANQFRARIYPIAANGYKEVKLSFASEIPDTGNYRLPLLGLPRLELLTILSEVALGNSTEGGSRYRQERISRTKERPLADYVLAAQEGRAGIVYKSAAVARIFPAIQTVSDVPKDFCILFDTSASRAPGYAAYVDKLTSVVSEIAVRYGQDLPIVVAAYDQQVGLVFEGPAGDYGDAQARALLARRPLGASNLEAALLWTGRQESTTRVLLIGDMMNTAGGDKLASYAAALPPLVARIDVLLVGGIQDREAALRIVGGARKVHGLVLSDEEIASEIVRRIGARVESFDIQVAGAEWVWPQQLAGVQEGDSFVLYAKFPDDESPDTLDVNLSGVGGVGGVKTIPLRPSRNVSVQRSLAQAKMLRLEGQYQEADAGPRKAALRDTIVAESIEHSVLSEHTAFLVMEDMQEPARVEEGRNTNVSVPMGAFEGGEALPSREGQSSDLGVSFSGTSSLERQYVVDGISYTGLVGKTTVSYFAGDPPLSSVPLFPNGMDFSCGRINRYSATSRFNSYLSYKEQNVGPVRDPKVGNAIAVTGKLAEVHRSLSRGDVEDAVTISMGWMRSDTASVLALVALGESLEAAGVPRLAARAYGSIIDLFPSRADLRRFAASRLARLPGDGVALAVDSLRKAVAQRPDHLTGHRLLAFALVRAGNLPQAFAALETGLTQKYPSGRFVGGKTVLREDIGIVASAWIHHDASVEKRVMARLNAVHAHVASEPSLRFVLNWETDTNDVDLHVR